MMRASLTCPWPKLMGKMAKQYPYAASRALNDIAWVGKAAEAKHLPEVFHLRNNWTVQGLRVENSTKRSLVATVYHLDWYRRLSLQETGGPKVPRGPARGFGNWQPSSPMMAIHPEGVGRAKPLRRREFPAGILQRPRVFIQATKRGRAFIAQRLTGRQAGQRLTRLGTPKGIKNRAFRIFFWLTPITPVLRPRMGLRETVRAASLPLWRSAFAKRMQEALNG